MSALRWKLVDESPQGALFADDDLVERHVGTGEFRGLEFLHVNARRIINEVPAASSMPFRFTVNAYRGCSHACAYCFARPTHQYLGLDIGRDFDSKIVVKVNAVERLRAEIRRPSWSGEHIAMGTNTDPYQRCEGKYHLTQGIIKALGEAANPFSILTKSTLILRDLDALAAAARRTDVRINLSIGCLDEAVWRALEPGTPHPRRRIEAVRRMHEAGLRCGVLIAPIVPGLSDGPGQVEEVTGACLDAGAESVTAISLHLRAGVRDHFFTWLRANHPELVASYERRYRGASLAKAEQQAVSARVRAVVQGRRHTSRFIDGAAPVTERMRRQGLGPGRPKPAPVPIEQPPVAEVLPLWEPEAPAARSDPSVEGRREGSGPAPIGR